MRVAIALDAAESEYLQRLHTVKAKRDGAAWAFWKAVCARRSLDPKTLIERTALPLGHDKHWCWPLPLQCAPVPDWIKQEANRYG